MARVELKIGREKEIYYENQILEKLEETQRVAGLYAIAALNFEGPDSGTKFLDYLKTSRGLKFIEPFLTWKAKYWLCKANLYLERDFTMEQYEALKESIVQIAKHAINDCAKPYNTKSVINYIGKSSDNVGRQFVKLMSKEPKAKVENPVKFIEVEYIA